MAKDDPQEIPQGLEAFAKAANKRYGVGALMTANHLSRIAVPRIPTGIWSLDKATGGGLPVGRFTQVFGWESTGKTTLYVRAIAEAQRICGNCYQPAELGPGEVITIDPLTNKVVSVESQVVVDCPCGHPRSLTMAWVDQEGTWDPAWATAHGVFPERLIMSWPEFAEEAVDIVEGLILSRSADIVVLDSVAAMSPSVEVKDSAQDFSGHPGTHARIMGTALRKWNSAIQSMNRIARSQDDEYRVPSIWLVNQLREKIGVKFGNPETKPGGNAIKFFTSVEVRTGMGAGYKVDDKEMETKSVELKFKVTKNKTAPARQGGNYRVCIEPHDGYETGQVMEHKTVLDHAMKHHLVERVSDRKYTFAGQDFIGQKQVIEYWKSQPDVFAEVRRMVLQIALQGDEEY